MEKLLLLLLLLLLLFMKINYFFKMMMIAMILIVNNYLIIKINYSILNRIFIIFLATNIYMTYIYIYVINVIFLKKKCFKLAF
jgi:hypothetical protein